MVFVHILKYFSLVLRDFYSHILNMDSTLRYKEEKCRLMEGALPYLPEEGFTDSLLLKVSEEIGYDTTICTLCFPRGGIDLVVYFVQSGLMTMEDRLAVAELSILKIRERITLAIRTRLEVDEGHKEVVRRACGLLLLPIYAVDSMRLLAMTSDKMWRCIGDVSLDGNFYSKRLILASIYAMVHSVWLSDDSVNYADTWCFLDKRIEHVMIFEKNKMKFKEGCSSWMRPLSTLATWRYNKE